MNDVKESDQATHDDFFLFDSERLSTIAPESTLKKGLAMFKENAVFDLGWDENAVWAMVEDPNFEEPFSVEVSRGDDAMLEVSCDCSGTNLDVCEHAVALLYRYAAHDAGPPGELHSAADAAIEERTKKGKTEVMVKQLAGDLHFGTWQAWSIASATHWKQVYQVQIRSVDERLNYCTCPDLATNRLGTCKHIEAVLHKIRKTSAFKKSTRKAAPVSFIYLAWESATHPRIILHRAGTPLPELEELLGEYFDAAGSFKRQVPEDFFRLTDAVYGQPDIQVGEDALLYARRCADDAAQALRAQRICREITQSGGVLPGVRARLYPYQVEGVAFLASRGKALLADDMGLGKTLQAISAASWLAEHSDVRRVLVVCPASLKHQWAREISKFTGHETQIVQGIAQARHVQYRTDKPFVVVNYELVLRDLSTINESLRPDLLILDEAQRIKNWRTKVASTIKLIQSRYAFVLTGTPLENRLEDLYSLLQVVDARVLGPLWRCMVDFHVTDERGKVIGYRNLSELRSRIAPVMLRRDRKLIRDQLPDRTEIRLDIPLTRKQRELHDDALSTAGYLANIAKRRPLTPSEQNRLMASLQQARMACNAAGLVDKATEGSPKLDELANLLEDLCLQSGHKAVIFSQWEQMTRMVEATVRKLGLGFVRLHGGVPSSKRGGLMDRFRDDDAVQVFISTDAGGVGLNLQSATVLINLDMPWNPAVLDQRIARVHRLGQTQKVQIVLMLADDSYEQQVAKLVQGKRDLFDNVISEEATEDVVGVSKRMLETLIEDLRDTSTGEMPVKETPPETRIDEAAKAEAVKDTAQDAAVRECIARIQDAFGPRIERVLGAGGGLLVVMQPVDAEAEAIAETLSDSVPVALIEPHTLGSLNRLGAASPIAEAKVLYKPDENTARPRISPFAQTALDKLRSAELLIERKSMAGAIEILASAMLAAAAAKAELAQIPTMEEAGVWIYSEALAKGILSPDQTTELSRALALARAPGVPEALVYEVLHDARLLVSAVT